MLKKFLSYYIYSNLHIALAAAIYVLAGYTLFNLDINWSFISVVFSGTVISYNVHRWIGYNKSSDEDRPIRFSFLIDNKASLLVINSLMTVLFITSAFVLPIRYYYFLIPLGLITASYLLPIIGNKKRLRDMPYIKIFAIAFVWATLFLIPALAAANSLICEIHIPILIQKFCFFFALTVPFDFRDRIIDKRQNVKTLGNELSFVQNQKLVIISVLVCMIITFYLFWINFISLLLLLTFIVFYPLLIYFGLYSLTKEDELFFLGWMDGFILLNGLVYIIIL